MDKAPNNIALWAMHRSGSTHFGQRLASSMEHIYGKPPNVVNLGEATGASGIVSVKNGGRGIWNELQDQLQMGTEFVTKHIRWELNENSFLTWQEYYGSVNEEITRRENIIKASAWHNHLVLRNMRWPKMKAASNRYDRAFVEGDFHHVVLWRKDIFAWICSRMIFRMTGTPHGKDLEYDGLEYKFHTEDAKTEFLERLYEYVVEFKNSLAILPPDRTTIIETTEMNSATQISWPDGCVLKLVEPEKIVQGTTVWKDVTTGNRVLPPDMVDDEEKEVFRNWANRVEQGLNWSELENIVKFKKV
jgi:hypothetical protein